MDTKHPASLSRVEIGPAAADGRPPHPADGHASHATPPPTAPQDGEEHVDTSSLPTIRTGSVVLIAATMVVALAGLFLLGFLPRRQRLAELRAETAARDPRPMVETAAPKRAASAFDLRLPADVRSMQQTSLYARANGYLARILVDIGDHVTAGQLLAEIDTPEVDAQLGQAKAAVGQAEANLAKAQNDFDLTDATFKRYSGFAQSGGVTQQQLDEKRSDFTQARSALDAGRASVAGAQADVERLTALQGFERLSAPFDGTITTRNYDVGALLSPSDLSTGKEVFRIDRTDVLRVFVSVPQPYVTSVKNGQAAHLSVRNYPGKEFAGTVTRSAGAIDEATRTLRYQIDVPNGDGALYAGMYGEVRLPITDAEPQMLMAASALVFDKGGAKVWVVESNQVHGKSIVVGRDFGTEVEIQSGLEGTEAVVINPGEQLDEGVEVRVASQAGQTERDQP